MSRRTVLLLKKTNLFESLCIRFPVFQNLSKAVHYMIQRFIIKLFQVIFSNGNTGMCQGPLNPMNIHTKLLCLLGLDGFCE